MILVKASHLRNEKLVTLIFPNHNQSTKKSPRVRKSSQLKSSSTLQVRGPAIRRRAVTTKLPSKLMRRIPREVIINPNKPNYEKQIHIKRSYILPNLVYFYNIAPPVSPIWGSANCGPVRLQDSDRYCYPKSNMTLRDTSSRRYH